MKALKALFSSFVFILCIVSPAFGDVQDLVINEVMTNPVEGGEYSFVHNAVTYTSDWIEIYNAGDTDVDMKGLYLSDRCDVPNTEMWRVGFNDINEETSIIVPAGGYKRIWCPGYFLGETGDDPPTPRPIPPDRAPFRLSSGGEWIGLYERDAGNYVLIDGFYAPDMLLDLSYGSLSDGDTVNRNYMGMPTPELTNAGGGNLPPKIEVRSFRGVDDSGDEVPYTVRISADQLVRVRVQVVDLDAVDAYNIESVNLHYQVSGGGFQQLLMYPSSDPREELDGIYEALIPGQSEGSVVEFYVSAMDKDDGESELWWSTLYNPNRATPLGFRYPVGQVGSFETAIRLNEILAVNGDCPAGEEPDPAIACSKGGYDNFNNYDDWVELYNTSAEPQSVIDLYLTNNELDPTRFALSDAISRSPNLGCTPPVTCDPEDLKPNSHLLIWCDNEPWESQTNYVHANFTLSGDDDDVFLVAFRDANDDGIPELFQIIDLVSWGPGQLRRYPDELWRGSQKEDWSIGRYPQDDPEAKWGLMAPSEGGVLAPGGENTGFSPYLVPLGWEPPAPVEGDAITFTARVWDDQPGFTVELEYFSWKTSATYTKDMRDDGQEGDAVADDGIFTAVVNAAGDTQVSGKMDYSITVTDADDNMRRFPRMQALNGRFHIGYLPNTSPSTDGDGHPVISEILANNRRCECLRRCDCEEHGNLPLGCEQGGVDANRNADDWVEIYNPHDHAIFLGDYYLSDRQDWTMRWQFPVNASLEPGERLVIWCDDEVAETTGTEYHTNFSLNGDHDEIMLLYENPSYERQIVDFLRFRDQIDDIPYGRIEVAEGENMLEAPTGVLMLPTPGEANEPLAALAEGIEEASSHPNGFCSGSTITVTGAALDMTQVVYIVPPLHDTAFGEIIYRETDDGIEPVWDYASAVALSTGAWRIEDENLLVTLPSGLEETLHNLCVLSAENLTWYDGGVPLSCLDLLITQDNCTGLPQFKRGDVNGDAKIDLADPIKILGYLFSNDELICKDAADTNDDGALDLADAISLLSYLFVDPSDLEPPFSACGVDPTDDALDCESFPPCP